MGNTKGQVSEWPDNKATLSKGNKNVLFVRRRGLSCKGQFCLLAETVLCVANNTDRLQRPFRVGLLDIGETGGHPVWDNLLQCPYRKVSTPEGSQRLMPGTHTVSRR